ncbi:Protein IDA-LIKE [Melia azedarach]|uniref:Protein IDA-LIKE n=1 Tax=Melia azedarach TaxID=155640 RepID=A0ACC1XH25_MELAZ|nr:Protein IDA-LIKE [Melia azedarach]
MASSSSSFSVSKSMLRSWKVMYILVLILFLIVGSCSAGRPCSRMLAEESQTQSMRLQKRKYDTGFKYKGMMFNFLPKGTPVPPSGPSKRHNAVVDSVPQN